MAVESTSPPVEDGAHGAEFRGQTPRPSWLPLAVAVVVLAVVGQAVLAKLASPGPAASAVASAFTTAVPSAGTTAGKSADPAAGSPPAVVIRAVESVEPPPRNPEASPFPAVAPVGVNAGRASLVVFGAAQVRLRADVPVGWARAGDGMLVKDGGRGPAGASISAWRVSHVGAVPCRWSSRQFADQDLSTLDGLTSALASWWGQDPTRLPYWNSPIAPLATRPAKATFLELPALRLEVLIPSGLDLGGCDGGQLLLWEAADGTARVGRDAGELHRLWVVGVGGAPIVVDASSFAATSQANLDELDGVLESLTLEP